MATPRLLAALLAAVFLAAPAAAEERSCMPGLTATADADGSVTLHWTPVDAAGVTGYQVAFRPAGGDWFPVSPQSSAASGSWTDEGAIGNVTYEYLVVAMMDGTEYGTYCSATATALGVPPPTPHASEASAIPYLPSAVALGAAVAGTAFATVFMVRRKK
ncbi:MAG: hypothetical protein ABR562_09060 [Thermoplasmatota archaeon]|nr:fibronectin type III domain-containing protein [Halobacteriales archaeon]